MLTTEARRNARIKKILENSEQRLRQITGVEHKSTVTEFDGMLVVKTFFIIYMLTFISRY